MYKKLFLMLILNYFSLGSLVQADELSADFSALHSNGIQVLSKETINERITDFLVMSDSLVEPAYVRITLPVSYQFQKQQGGEQQRYPVLYLLHGGGADHTQWTELGADKVSADLDLIIVQPYGGRGSWYRDASYSSLTSKALWETYFIKELLPWVDATFRTHALAQQRAIAGLSMGGYGAVVMAARYPELFTSVSSFSGAMDISGIVVACWIGVSPLIEMRLPHTIFGLCPFDKKVRLQHNPVDLAENLRNKHLAFYFGNGNKGPLDEYSVFNVPYRFMGWLQENQVYHMNIAMHEKLKSLNIAHHYQPYGDGMHASAYWKKSFAEELPKIMRALENFPVE